MDHSVRSVGVVGAGTMGNGIAHVFAQYGYPVTMIDVSPEALQRGLSTITKNLDRMVAKEKLTAAAKDHTLQRINTSTSIEEAVRHARASGDQAAAALIVERSFHTALFGGGLSMAESWVRLLAPEAVERRPALILARAWIAFLRGRSALHGRLLDEADASLAAHAGALEEPTRAALQLMS